MEAGHRAGPSPNEYFWGQAIKIVRQHCHHISWYKTNHSEKKTKADETRSYESKLKRFETLKGRRWKARCEKVGEAKIQANGRELQQWLTLSPSPTKVITIPTATSPSPTYRRADTPPSKVLCFIVQSKDMNLNIWLNMQKVPPSGAVSAADPWWHILWGYYPPIFGLKLHGWIHGSSDFSAPPLEMHVPLD